MKTRLAFEYWITAIILMVLALVIITGTFAYKRFTEIVSSISEGSRPDIRLIAAKSFRNHITDAENSVKSFSLTKDTLYLDQFYESVRNANDKMTGLIGMGVEEAIDIQAMDSLVARKFWILNDLLLMQDAFRAKVALDKVMHKIERSVAEGMERTPEEEKKNFVGRLFGIGKKKEETLTGEPSQQIALSRLSREVQEVKDEEKSIERTHKLREMSLIVADKSVTRRIFAMLDTLESFERRKIEMKVDEAEEAVEQTNRKIALFCAAIGMLLVIMAFSLISYIRNRRQYRRALNQAKLEAEDLAATKQRFLATMSHEIRTPLTAIAGFTEQIADGPLTGEQREHLKMVNKSTEHLLYVVNDVLDITKLQSGKLKLELTGFSPRELVDDVGSFLKPMVEDKDVEIKYTVEDQVPEVLLGDPYRLRQILLNLTGNAVKFTDKGSVSITVSVVMPAATHARLRLEVADTGIGMGKEQLDRVFEEFEQAATHTTRHYGGTGLGLSIVKKLVDLHDGNIRLTSTPNHGTTVLVEIPYEIGTAADITSAGQTYGKELTDFIKGLRVLVVDDEQYNRRLLRTILKKHHTVLTEVKNGKEAVEEVMRNDYDIVLMDARMPILNGIDAARQIRALPDKQKNSVPIVALTAAVGDADIKSYKQAGMNGLLVKPYREKQLLAEINKTLHFDGDRQTADEADAAAENEHTAPGAQPDFGELRETCDGDTALYKEMLGVFLDGTKEGMEALRKSLNAREWDRIAGHAHKLCGPCMHLGADKLLTHLKEIEHRCREKTKLDSLDAVIRLAEKEADVFIDLVQKEIDRA